MKNFYSFLGAILIAGSVFAQGIALDNLKPAKKNPNNAILTTVKSPSYITLRQAVDCSTSDAFYCEDFEGNDIVAPALPSDMSTISEESNYFVPAPGATSVQVGQGVQVSGFFTGNASDANVGGFLPVEEHTQFAMTNDDSCMPANSAPNENNNCDLSFERLILPTLDFTGQAGMWLLFEYYEDGNYGGGDSKVELTTDGNNWIEIGGPLEKAEAWQTAAFDLSAYEGEETVTIRITWSDGNSWASGFAIDDIVINPLPDYAINLIEIEQAFPSTYFGRTSYQQVPLSQASATAYNFIGALKNLGLNALDSARLHASITSEGFSTTSFGINTLSLAQDTFFCNDVWTPTSAGTYTADIYGASDNNISTATESVTFTVSETEYARDAAGTTSDYTGGSYINDQGDEQRGNIFDIYADETLYAIKVRIHPATSPNTRAKAILNTVDPTSGDVSYLTETGLKDVGASADVDGWYNFVFDTPIPVTAGEVLLPTIYSDFNGLDTLVIANNGASDIGETLLQDISGTNGDAGEWYYTSATAMVRLSFDPNVVGINEFKAGNINIYPNPSNGSFNLDINRTESSDLELTIQNTLGQIVYSETLSNVSKLQKQINLSNLEAGIYTVTITDESKLSSSQKVIIQ
ncbi:MAG: T9SS type A sorting domain-containing protein [Flavobacteriales bacterium]